MGMVPSIVLGYDREVCSSPSSPPSCFTAALCSLSLANVDFRAGLTRNGVDYIGLFERRNWVFDSDQLFSKGRSWPVYNPNSQRVEKTYRHRQTPNIRNCNKP